MVVLEEVTGRAGVRIKVSQDVIDFLELHNVQYSDGITYYIVNNCMYKVIGTVDEP